MSQSIALSISTAFAELSISGSDGNSNSQKRFYISQQPLGRVLRPYLEEAVTTLGPWDQVVLQDRTGRDILDRHLGASPAILVTSGFEHWLEMSLPIETDYFTTHPQRRHCPFNRDLVFGLTERMDAHGNVVKDLDPAELEYLVSKLKMNQVESIALGFLHANKNSKHEDEAAHFFEDQGFKVYQCKPDNDQELYNERHRWWHAVLCAYLTPTQREFREACENQVREALPESCRDIPLHWINAEQKSRPAIEDLFCEWNQIGDWPQVSAERALVYLGFEEFWVASNSPVIPVWQGEYGPVYCRHRPAQKTGVQPTQTFVPGFWGRPQLSKESLGFNPGPMLMGRGLKPTLLDLMIHQGFLKEHTESTDWISDSHQRFVDAFDSLCPDKMSRSEIPEYIQSVLGLAMDRLALQLDRLSETGEVSCFGPLAQALVPKINQRLARPRFRMAGDYWFSRSLLEGAQ